MSGEGQWRSFGATTFGQRPTTADEIVSDLGARLLVGDERLDAAAIDDAITALGRLLVTERSYVFEFSSDRLRMSNTFEWCAPGVPTAIEMLQDLPVAGFPWLMDRFENDEAVACPIDELPDEANSEREILIAQGIRSVLLIPLRHSDEVIGFIGFDQLDHPRRWTTAETDPLRKIALPLASAIGRIRIIERLRTDEEQLRVFTECLNTAACIFEASLERGLYANPAFEALTGISAEEFLMDPRCMSGIVHPDDLEELVATIGRFELTLADSDEPSPTAEHTCRLVIGDAIRWVRCTAFALDHTGMRTRVGALLDDITERRALQQELTAALQRAAAANQAKTDFLSRVSHELRTPLHGTLGFLQLLRLDPDSPDRYRYLDAAQRSCEELVSLIDDLLEVTRIETGRLEVHLAQVDLGELVDDIVMLAAPSATEHDVTVAIERAGVLPLVRSDRRRLAQILTNLISNGIKYTPRGGHVTIGIRHEAGDEVVTLEIGDDGRGIAPEDLTRLFVPYERFGDADRTIAGAGLGLAVTRQLAGALGHSLTVDSTPEVGSTFTLELPCALQHPSDARPFTVLCVDDNESSLAVLGAAIGRLPGVRMRTAGSLEEALSAAVSDRPDLVLLDRQLPDGDGLEAVGRFTALTDGQRPVRVAMVTADTSPDTYETAIERGALRLFTKPLDLGELVAFVGAHAAAVSP